MVDRKIESHLEDESINNIDSANEHADVVDSVAAESASTLSESVDLNAKVSEKSKKGPSDQIKKGGTSAQGSVAKKPIVRIPPATTREMKREVKEAIETEIKILQKKVKKLQSSNDYSQMNDSVKQIRSLSALLKTLIRASVDSVREMWGRFVGSK